jgi:hypothetical protein
VWERAEVVVSHDDGRWDVRMKKLSSAGLVWTMKYVFISISSLW